MAYSEQQYRQRISLGQSDNALVILVGINLILFVMLGFVKAIWYFRYPDQQTALFFFNKNVLSWFTLPASFETMMSQPWSVLTYAFVHMSIWQVFANMLWLWGFGYIMQDLTGNKKIIPIFIYGAVAGAVAFIGAYHLIPSLKPLMPVATAMGASAGVMAVAIATTLVAPGYKIFPMLNGGIPLWVLTSIYIITDLATLSLRDYGTLSMHLGGALTGVLFMLFLRKGYDLSEWMNNFFDWIGNLFNPEKANRKRNIKEELFYRSTVTPFKKTPNVTQQRIDEILDKINQKGYHFLTEEEKELLRRASKEDI
jgi:membrane associated rhomboid family serine protease